MVVVCLTQVLKLRKATFGSTKLSPSSCCSNDAWVNRRMNSEGWGVALRAGSYSPPAAPSEALPVFARSVTAPDASKAARSRAHRLRKRRPP